ncbi:MAG: DUF1456 family protein [Balneolaceae bacterium]|nr:MAG: DUF1456 family protein [Balneolaceae bacterium]
MRNDDVILNIRYMLNISNSKIAEIIEMGGYKPKREEIEHLFRETKEEEEKDDVSDKLMAHFLDGLIYFKRGKSEKHPQPALTLPVTNNQILKKLRVAFKLREEHILKTLKNEGLTVSGSELNALFRDKSHRNYQPCGDQLLRYFLRGLTKKMRKLE